MRNKRTQSMYEINTRLFLREYDTPKKKAKILDVPFQFWENLSRLGIDNVWLMGLWKIPKSTINKYCLDIFLIDEYKQSLKDFCLDDVVGSPYSIEDYVINPEIGTFADIKILKKTLNSLGINLFADFISNHFSSESSLLKSNPEIFLHVSKNLVADDPFSYFNPTNDNKNYFAHGRDPFFSAWKDTALVNYFSEKARNFMINKLLFLSEIFDGIRVDMAMLSLNNVFQNTWGGILNDGGFSAPEKEFWEIAVQTVKKSNPNFVFIGEVYWDLEWELQRLGFDFTYDKTLTDRLKGNFVIGIKEHLQATEDFQLKSVRFLENHDEPRAVHYLGVEKSKAAAIIISTTLGMSFYFHGQFEGEKVKLPVQLGRKPHCSINENLQSFYMNLLKIATNDVFKYGEWLLLNPIASWSTDVTYRNILAYLRFNNGQFRLVITNYSNETSSARIKFEPPEGMREFVLTDLLDNNQYTRNSTEIRSEGLYVKLSPYQSHIFAF